MQLALNDVYLRRGGTGSRRRWWLLIALLAMAGMSRLGVADPPPGDDPAAPHVGAGEQDSAADESGKPTGDEPNPLEQAEGEGPAVVEAAEAIPGGQRHSAKLIPDQVAYVGSPPTVIDLSEIFADTDVAAGGQPLSISIVRNEKDKVADATLNGDHLTLAWKNEGTTEIIVRAINAKGDYVDNKFIAKVWRADFWQLVMTVVGGLGIFLLGMKNMSEGMQAIAGNGLRRMISLVTTNRFLAVIVGFVVTTLIQSSSITTVMVVGFVNSGFMTLTQAIGVIMGANIGTTITGWILALKIGHYGLPILGAAVFVYLFSRRDRLRYFAMAVMGLGMVFLGLELMKDGFSIIKDLPTFEEWFHRFHADTYWGVLQCAAVGCVLTFIVQSSSATLGITIGLAEIGVIPFETAAALVLGENIGTTITALLASLGTTTNARRAAYFHCIFNVLGVLWITAIFTHIYMPAIRWWYSIEPFSSVPAPNVTAAIATVHTVFNVANTLLFLPFVGFFARLLERVVPDRAVKEKHHLTPLDVRALDTPVLAIEQSRVEVVQMGHGCNKMMDWLGTITASDQVDEELVRKVFHREEVLDTVQDEVVAYLTNLLAENAPVEIVDESRRQLRIADEYESVSDYITAILKSQLKLRRSELSLPEPEAGQLRQLHSQVAAYVQMITDGYEHRQPEVITKAKSDGSAITKEIKQLRERFLQRMGQDVFDPQISVAFLAQLNAYRRVRDHALNVAEAHAIVFAET